MAKVRFYVCPVCGNLLTGTGNCGIFCCGRKLEPLSPAAEPEPLNLKAEEMDLDYYISWDHPMQKDIFCASLPMYRTTECCSSASIRSQGAAVRIPASRRDGTLYLYCISHGLQKHKLKF